MKKFLAIAALALPMMAAPVVTYSIAGTFTPGSTNVLSGPGGGTVTYLTGFGSVDLGVLNPSNITFGTLNTTGSPGALDGAKLDLVVTQTSPANDMGTLSGDLKGTVVVDSSQAYITFATPTLILNGGAAGPIEYRIFQSDLGGGKTGIAIVPQTTDQGGTVSGGTTTLQGEVSAHVPEPSTVALMGLGLAAVGFIGRRRRA